MFLVSIDLNWDLWKETKKIIYKESSIFIIIWHYLDHAQSSASFFLWKETVNLGVVHIPA